MCEKLFNETHFRKQDGRYVVRMPLNHKIKLLGKSKASATKHFLSLERKFQRNEEFKKNYHSFINEFIRSGFLSLIDDPIEKGYYTPHHAVQTSAKFRTVLNSSFASSSGISLNECQYTGPKLQDDLSIILIRFRMHKTAFTADIAKMYCQVEINDEHKKYQKIIWRQSPNEPIKVYALNRVAFGQTAAPYLAIRTLRQCAKDHESEFPLAAPRVLDSFYVDDLLSGANSEKKALALCQQLTALLEKGKFELAKWSSNSKLLNKRFGGNTNETPIKDEEKKSVLGLFWFPAEDKFGFKLQPPPQQSQWTKRQILSQVGKIYDPTGFIAPIVLIPKLLMQQIWQASCDWDLKQLSIDGKRSSNNCQRYQK